MKVLVNGEPVSLSPDDIRHWLVASMRKEVKRLALSPEGDAVILLAGSSRTLTTAEASELLEYIYAVATMKGIRLIDPNEKAP
jgi:hypothetical protein